jgi:hypothetical protein
MNMRTFRIAPLMLLPIALFIGCSKDKNDNPTAPGTGTLQVRMTDAPGAFDAVNLVVTEVAVNVSAAAADSDSARGWVVLNHDSTTYDLIQMQNGTFRVIGSTTLAAGTYSQIRLKIGAGSTVVVNGQTFPLTVPSGAQSGLKIQGPFVVSGGQVTDVLIDFDASRSIIQTGNGTYMLKPVIHVMNGATAGSIHGIIVPSTATSTVTAEQGSDTLGTAVPNANGEFTMSVLAPGTYSVRINPAATTYRDTILANVSVTGGHTTQLGVVTLAAPAPMSGTR